MSPAEIKKRMQTIHYVMSQILEMIRTEQDTPFTDEMIENLQRGLVSDLETARKGMAKGDYSSLGEDFSEKVAEFGILEGSAAFKVLRRAMLESRTKFLKFETDRSRGDYSEDIDAYYDPEPNPFREQEQPQVPYSAPVAIPQGQQTQRNLW